MTDSDAVLAANLEFYRAFAARDIPAMDGLWARRAPVACLHPGWTALTGREQVMASWTGILSNPNAPRIACYDERVLLFGDSALVLCEEELDGGTLAASNFFVREDGGCRGSTELPVAATGGLVGGVDLGEAPRGRWIDAAIDQARPKPALERRDRRFLHRRAIADRGEVGAGGGKIDRCARRAGRRLRPQPDPGPRQPRPVEQFAGVGLALRRDVGVADDPVGGDRMAGENVAAQLLDRRHLGLGKWAVAPFVAGIGDLDSDRHEIEIALAAPARHTGMEGAPLLGNQAPDRAVLFDKIMGADPGRRVAQPVERRAGAAHAGIMQHQHIDPWRLAAGAVIGRGAGAHRRSAHGAATGSAVIKPDDRLRRWPRRHARRFIRPLVCKGMRKAPPRDPRSPPRRPFFALC